MKPSRNIHILPTDKPSRLWLTKLGNLTRCHDIKPIKEVLGDNVNIYITSDEEDINENDYIITKDGKLVQLSYLLSKDLQGASKIILTTDTDLIKDGVQKIDDEFLEWFVKNPRCDEVKTEYGCCGQCDERLCEVFDLGLKQGIYKIIIPKEELKKKYSNSYNEEDDKLRSEILNKYLDSKKETLEEGFIRSIVSIDYTEADFASFKLGAKWQQDKICNSEVLQRIRASKSDAEARRIIKTI